MSQTTSRLWYRRGSFRLSLVLGLVLLAGVAGLSRTRRQAVSPILQDLHAFRALGSVLYMAAHPDDENTQLITYLVRGRGYRTAYLSLTRGDGGQNLLGPDFGEALGVARTQELLAARRLDGGQQFFTRARDFGFSKDYHETLSVWDSLQVLSDVVRVLRTFRPDVIITRFSPEPGGTHGHHTTSAVLALEAFKLAGSPDAFPEQLRTLRPWQPKRVLQNVGASGGRGSSTIMPALRLDVSGHDPVLNESYTSIARRSRGMHITQGFGPPGGTPPTPGRDTARYESFIVLAGEHASGDIMDGVDASWNRVPGGGPVAALTDSIIAQFDVRSASASVPALLRLRRLLADLPVDPVLADKRVQLDRIIQAALGLEVHTTVASAEVVPGEEVRLEHVAGVGSNVPVRWVAIRYPGVGREVREALPLPNGRTVTRVGVHRIPQAVELTQPYWLREAGTAGMFRVDDASLIGQPQNPPAFPIEHDFEVDGQILTIRDQPVAAAESGTKSGRPLDIIAPVAIDFPADVTLFAPGATRPVHVSVHARRPQQTGTLQLQVPAGWQVTPAGQEFSVNDARDTVQLTFNVTAPSRAATASITASARVKGTLYQTGRSVIDYEHIPLQLLQPRAQHRAVSLELAIRGRQVGYLPGAGDAVPVSLQQMGYNVTLLDTDDLRAERLNTFDAVVIGIRAFNVRTDLAETLPALFQYVEQGGNLIVQYNVASGLLTSTLAPFPLQISSGRITDEHAAPTFLAPDHPALNTPNRITLADFEGWVQERGLYFPGEWDARFTPILAFNDPGERALNGGLLVAQHGRGYFVYTGLAFFRQLPAGVPGAYRLFANLLSLGK